MRPLAKLLPALLLFVSGPALAWGDEGHRAVAFIARSYLTPAVRAKVDALLASDPDTLTAPDMASRATWADAWRGAGHRETASWHFVDIELAAPDLSSACFGFPVPADPASAGPAQDCVVDKVREFQTELAAPNTPPAERVLALKYLLHFVGDLHQPLHASDNQDRGGNCVLVSIGGTKTVNLHSYWDTVVVGELGNDAPSLAPSLRATITPAQLTVWRKGDAASWAQESFAIARSTVYRLGSQSGCNRDASPVALPDSYDIAARQAAALQLKRAGVRLAVVLNRALAGAPVSTVVASSPVPPIAVGRADGAAPVAPSSAASGRTQASLACSAEADRRGLHGDERRRFRRGCMRA